MAYDTVIGVEVHAQLKTNTKLFCGCAIAVGELPNSHTCPVCLGMPGALPVLNRRAVDMAVRTGLALHCSIGTSNQFARKNYFYPDLPKGYQISQYEQPICGEGWLAVTVHGKTKRVRIRRAHLEEDAGKNIHQAGQPGSHVDLNRAGTPLLEIVTEPDLASADEVDAYLRALRDILMYLDVCDGNMECGNLRCEPNISLRLRGTETLGTKVELKNLNSFRFVRDAVEYEVSRQARVLSDGGDVQQETRLWNEQQAQTVVMRSKEEAHDYRYFPDPDLLPVSLEPSRLEQLQETIPELPAARRQRFVQDYDVSEGDAATLTATRELADYYESCVALFPTPKTVANWVQGELLRELNTNGCAANESAVTPERLVSLLRLVDDGTVSLKAARELFPEFYASGKSAEQLIDENGLRQVSDDGALNELIQTVLADCPAQVAQYRGGKHAVLGFLVGQVMKASKGTANPGKVHALLQTTLSDESS